MIVRLAKMFPTLRSFYKTLKPQIFSTNSLLVNFEEIIQFDVSPAQFVEISSTYIRVFSQFTSWWTNRLPQNPLSLLEEKFDSSHILFHMFGFLSGSIRIGDWCFMFHQPLRLSPKPGSKTFSGGIPLLNPPLWMKMSQIFVLGAPNATLVECLSAHPVWPPSSGGWWRQWTVHMVEMHCRVWRKNKAKHSDRN